MAFPHTGDNRSAHFQYVIPPAEPANCFAAGGEHLLANSPGLHHFIWAARAGQPLHALAELVYLRENFAGLAHLIENVQLPELAVNLTPGTRVGFLRVSGRLASEIECFFQPPAAETDIREPTGSRRCGLVVTVCPRCV